MATVEERQRQVIDALHEVLRDYLVEVRANPTGAVFLTITARNGQLVGTHIGKDRPFNLNGHGP